MSFANSFSSFPPPGTAQAPRLVDTPPRPVPRAPEATVPAVPPVPGLPSPIGAADQLRDEQDVRDLEIVNQRLLDELKFYFQRLMHLLLHERAYTQILNQGFLLRKD